MSVPTTLSQTLQPFLESHPGLNGIHLLSDPLDAFAVRTQLLERAEQTVDLQYYIWADDTAGRSMLDAVHRAAQRGVRVRMLLDDFGCLGADELFGALNRHPHIEIRLFNPLISRRLKWTGYFTNFSRINRRMHNKAFTIDQQVTIVGGRNIGDIYFDGAGENSFVDLDVLAIGPVAQEISADFNGYWISASSYPAADFLPTVDRERQQQLMTELSQHNNNEAERYRRATQDSPLLADILAGRTQLTWAPITMVSDDPAKAVEKCRKADMLSQQLTAALGEPRSRMVVVSPYFIPMKRGVALLRALVDKGVSVSLLTNSLAASDVPLVHIAYSKYRKALTKAGVKLFEMRATDTSGMSDTASDEPAPQQFRSQLLRGTDRKAAPKAHKASAKRKHGLVGSKSQRGKAGIMGSKSASLHAKTFAVDSQKLFVGSLNLDPRSTQLNTELGFLIESPELAMQLEAYFDTVAAKTCYQLSLSERGRLCWLEQTDNHTVHHTCEPQTTFCTRLLNRCYALLPLDPFL